MAWIIESPAMRRVHELTKQIGPSTAPVLISGETGTGKEVIAEMIQFYSERKNSPFIRVNCAAIPKDLLESELFGSVRGAYTGSIVDRRGLFQAADTGTIYLDELSEMTFDLQAKLLRVVENQMIRRVGDTVWSKVDVRIISSINRPPDLCVELKVLRDDLYYRIGTFHIRVPPMRQRVQDILPLCRTYLDKFSAEQKRVPPTLSPEVIAILQGYHWPGNVRQIVNEMHRLAVISKAVALPEDIDFHLEKEHDFNTPLSRMELMEKTTIENVLLETGGNKLEAAKRLGIGRQTLYNKLHRYNIEAIKEKPPGDVSPGGNQPFP